jgi:hypothetical protein
LYENLKKVLIDIESTESWDNVDANLNFDQPTLLSTLSQEEYRKSKRKTQKAHISVWKPIKGNFNLRASKLKMDLM